jgi:Pyruvate/2-oxoacid:ferredoxin oxidoreductase gamma subunit
VLAREDRPEYTRAWAETVAARATPAESERLRPRFLSPLDRRLSLVVAGSAGGKVRTAARLAARAAVLSSLYAAQRDDYPVTVKTGYSLSELILSPAPIDDVGVAVPDVLVIASDEGRRQAARRLAALGPEGRVYALAAFAGIETRARKLVVDPSRRGLHVPAASTALALLAAALVDLDVVPAEALLAAAEAEGGARHGEDSARALALGVDLAGLVQG